MQVPNNAPAAISQAQPNAAASPIAQAQPNAAASPIVQSQQEEKNVQLTPEQMEQAKRDLKWRNLLTFFPEQIAREYWFSEKKYDDLPRMWQGEMKTIWRDHIAAYGSKKFKRWVVDIFEKYIQRDSTSPEEFIELIKSAKFQALLKKDQDETFIERFTNQPIPPPTLVYDYFNNLNQFFVEPIVRSSDAKEDIDREEKSVPVYAAMMEVPKSIPLPLNPPAIARLRQERITPPTQEKRKQSMVTFINRDKKGIMEDEKEILSMDLKTLKTFDEQVLFRNSVKKMITKKAQLIAIVRNTEKKNKVDNTAEIRMLFDQVEELRQQAVNSFVIGDVPEDEELREYIKAAIALFNADVISTLANATDPSRSLYEKISSTTAKIPGFRKIATAATLATLAIGADFLMKRSAPPVHPRINLNGTEILGMEKLNKAQFKGTGNFNELNIDFSNKTFFPNPSIVSNQYAASLAAGRILRGHQQAYKQKGGAAELTGFKAMKFHNNALQYEASSELISYVSSGAKGVTKELLNKAFEMVGLPQATRSQLVEAYNIFNNALQAIGVVNPFDSNFATPESKAKLSSAIDDLTNAQADLMEKIILTDFGFGQGAVVQPGVVNRVLRWVGAASNAKDPQQYVSHFASDKANSAELNLISTQYQGVVTNADKEHLLTMMAASVPAFGSFEYENIQVIGYYLSLPPFERMRDQIAVAMFEAVTGKSQDALYSSISGAGIGERAQSYYGSWKNFLTDNFNSWYADNVLNRPLTATETATANLGNRKLLNMALELNTNPLMHNHICYHLFGDGVNTFLRPDDFEYLDDLFRKINRGAHLLNGVNPANGQPLEEPIISNAARETLRDETINHLKQYARRVQAIQFVISVNSVNQYVHSSNFDLKSWILNILKADAVKL